MENKVKKVKVDYAAIIREFEMYGRGRSLKQFCDESNYTYFMDMNDEMKLRLAYAEIARLKEEKATANRGQIDIVAHDQAMRADFERQREEDRQFFKTQLDNMKEFYMQQMKDQAERHKAELKQLRIDNRENVKRVMEESACHQKASDNLIASLNEKISKLTAMLEKSAISETEAKWLASVTTWQNK